MFYYDSFVPNDINGAQLDTFLSLGWYRMNQYVFCTSHIEHDEQPYRVHWLRYPISELSAKPSHKRIRNRNRNFQFTIEDLGTIRPDHTELHKRYRETIIFNGALSVRDCLFGDYQMDRNIFNTKCISVFDKEKLIAGGYFDLGEESSASILHFFDPEYSRYSLGKYLILLTLDYLRDQQYKFYYPGYVVQGLSKMNYKLFLGKEHAQYFDPHSISWKNFTGKILNDEKTNGLPGSIENSTEAGKVPEPS